MTETFRCAAASLADGEPLAGSAPEDQAWLFVEYPGAWGRRAVAESRLPEPVRDLLEGLEGVRVQLIRRHRGGDRGVRLFAAQASPMGAQVWRAELDDVSDLLDLSPAALQPGRGPESGPFVAHHEPLWLVCTNGKRDRCCAEAGRPVAAAVSRRWPEETWETTHLGGHRFSATLLALPSGLTLGRVDPESAVSAGERLGAGEWPTGLVRGRAGLPTVAQVAEQHLRTKLGADRIDDVEVVDVSPASRTPSTHDVRLRAGEATYLLTVRTDPGTPRRQSCADDKLKPTPELTVVDAPRPG